MNNTGLKTLQNLPDAPKLYRVSSFLLLESYYYRILIYYADRDDRQQFGWLRAIKFIEVQGAQSN